MILLTPPASKFAICATVFVCLLGFLIMPAFASGDITVSIAPFIDALNKSPTTYFYKRDYIAPEDQLAIPGIAAECLGHVDGIKVSAHDGAAAYKIIVSATSYRKRFFVVAQATDAQGVLRGLQADFLDLEELKRNMCKAIIRPLGEKLLHPVPETPQSAKSLQMLVEGIGFVNNGFRETAYIRLYGVLIDHPREADALFWLAKAFANEHPDMAKVHAREFLAGFPDDPRRPEIKTLLSDLSDYGDH